MWWGGGSQCGWVAGFVWFDQVLARPGFQFRDWHWDCQNTIFTIKTLNLSKTNTIRLKDENEILNGCKYFVMIGGLFKTLQWKWIMSSWFIPDLTRRKQFGNPYIILTVNLRDLKKEKTLRQSFLDLKFWEMSRPRLWDQHFWSMLRPRPGKTVQQLSRPRLYWESR